MSVVIKVNYPEVDDVVSPDHVTELMRMESVITGNAVELFGSTSNYTWVFSENIAGTTYYILKKNYDRSKVIEVSIRDVKDWDVERFYDELKACSFRQ